MNKMKLNKAEKAWIASVTEAGMTVAPAAIKWAEASHWATEAKTLRGVYDLLNADVADGELNGASRREALLFLAVLCKAASPEAAAPAEPPALDESDRREIAWGTSDPAEALARVGRPAHPNTYAVIEDWETAEPYFLGGRLLIRAGRVTAIKESPTAPWVDNSAELHAPHTKYD
jgi:hypothetical protein